MKGRTLCALAATSVLVGCSAPDGSAENMALTGAQAMQRVDEAAYVPTLLRTLPWLGDFRVSARTCQGQLLTRQGAAFSPGEPIHLSMRVNEAPRGTVVTAYWYGPGNESLGYEKQTISPGQERLRFIRDDTRSWRQGSYRAEVWIGELRLQGVPFDMVAAQNIGTTLAPGPRSPD